MVHVLICTDQDGHCEQDVCVLAVSEDKDLLEDLIETKKQEECYKYCKFRICDEIKILSGQRRTRAHHQGCSCGGTSDDEKSPAPIPATTNNASDSQVYA